MKAVIRKYMFLMAVCAVNLLVLALRPSIGLAAFQFTGRNIISFVVILTPIFLLIGLMDVWIERETAVRILGNRSGLCGALLAFLLGAVTAVPMYALLPVAGIMLRKSCRISNVLIFLGSSAGVRIPLLLFEISSLGWRFTLVRFAANAVAVFAMALLIDRLLSEEEKKRVYESANRLD
jgi:uncharacterized membrane protein YraQ (UPF0718 family)